VFFPYFKNLSQTVRNVVKTQVENVPVIKDGGSLNIYTDSWQTD
jgi:hypothetical protein